MAYVALLDLLRQVANKLQPAHGGTGSSYGEQRTVVKALNSTGASLALYTLVEPTFGANDLRIQKVAATNSKTVLGVVVGYFAGDGQLVEAAAPDGREVAVQTAGVVPVLIESAVTRADYAYAAATDGKMQSSSTASAGAFGLVLDSADVSSGATTARVFLPTTASVAGSTTISYATPAFTFDSTAAGGAASTLVRSDAQIALFDGTSPTTQAIGDSAVVGTAGKAARRDHKHGMPAFATNTVVLGTAAAAGSAATLMRSDATIAAFDTTAPVTQAFGDAAAVGTAAFAARRDHKHGMPAIGTGSSDAAAGNHTHDSTGLPSRLAFSDPCIASGTPAGVTTAGDALGWDGTRLRRELGGTQASSYQTPNIALNGPLIIEVVHDTISGFTAGNFQVEMYRASGSTLLGRAAYQSDGNMVAQLDGSSTKSAGGTTTTSTTYVKDDTADVQRTTLWIHETKGGGVEMGQGAGGGAEGQPPGTGQGSGRFGHAGARYTYSGTLNAGDDIFFKLVTSSTRKVGIYLVRVWRGAIAP